jgi:GcrA cell cycle regulator
MDNYWSEERLNQAIALWGEGRSASEIATALGGVSRNAVTGKINRLQAAGKVPRRKEQSLRPTRAEPAPPAQVPAPSRFRHQTAVLSPVDTSSAQHGANTVPPDIPAESGSPSFRSIKLHELEANECHWPVTNGHGSALFCGNGTARLESFCPYHARLAYQPRQATRGGR